MSQENLELTRLGFAALNRTDPDAFIALCDPRFAMHLVGVVGEPVYYGGADGVHQFVADMSEMWSDFGVEIEEIRDLDDQVLVIGKWWARGRVSDIEVNSPRGWVVAVRGGFLTAIRFFLTPEEALKAVGLEE